MRLVTINTGKGDGAYARRLDLLVDGLRPVAPDVLGLQEALVASDGSMDTARYLADRLEMHAVSAPARRKVRQVEGRDVLSESNVALLTRLPVHDSHALRLPSDDADGDRVALLARLHTGHTIAVVHLTHMKHAHALRRRQVQTLLADPWLATGGLIAGDLNTDLPLLMDLFAESPGWSVRDMHAEAPAAQGQSRATVPVHLPADAGRCLDYVLSLARDARHHPDVIEASIVLAEPDASGIYPSDHRGVSVTLHSVM